MGRCTIDHSREDTVHKLSEQKEYLPKDLVSDGEAFLRKAVDQETLNEVFHLLKKYDLATEEEKVERNHKLENVFRTSI